LRDAAGVAWIAAAGIAFVTMICESAGPVVEAGEEKPKPGALRIASLIVSLFTPMLLFVHAYYAVVVMHPGGAPGGLMGFVLAVLGSAALIGLCVLMLILILAPSVLAALVRVLSRPAARALYAAAPVLTFVTFGLALFVTQQNFLAAVGLVLNHL
jgi:hypothetical protein